MFADSKATRAIGFGVLAAIAAISGVFFYILDQPERRQASELAPDKAIAEVEEVTRKLETARFALKPTDIALMNRKLAPGQKVAWNAGGQQQQSSDLFHWTVSGEAKNLSPQYSVQNLSLRVRLYDCPVFFTTPAEEAQLAQLSRDCSLSGQRTLGLYDVKIAPGATYKFSEPVEFNDQIEPRNWRYWVEVSNVSAVAE
ncbi:MAG: hypothetical protein GY948_25170 [Alphaproteobacteria bacterium]|nr:hypothetical protein [Alphaproteobacteria bacterium]